MFRFKSIIFVETRYRVYSGFIVYSIYIFSIILRVYQGWLIENNTFRAMLFQNGDECGGKYRSLRVCFCIIFTIVFVLYYYCLCTLLLLFIVLYYLLSLRSITIVFALYYLLSIVFALYCLCTILLLFIVLYCLLSLHSIVFAFYCL